MGFGIFSVTGEALNFGARRMETIMRVAWLPVTLLLVFNMAAAFSYLSVANGRLITYSDLSNEQTFDHVLYYAQQAAGQGLAQGSAGIWIIYAASLLINAILVASFMAPLIRYAGLGEKPAPGVIRMPFGGDQVLFLSAGLLSFVLSALFVYAPIGVASYFIISAITKALMTPYASFPDESSLHTVDVISGAEVLASRGTLWLYDYGYWGVGAAALGLVLLGTMLIHFRRGRDGSSAVGRALTVVASLVAFFAAFVLFGIGQLSQTASTTASIALSVFFASALALGLYANLRLYPYAGVAVCRRSLAPGGLLAVTRGANIFRLFMVIVVLGLIVFLAEILLNVFGVSWIVTMFSALGAAVASYTGIFNEGEAAPWVTPFFKILIAGVQVVFSIFWTFFTYGVSAGLLGRLYRESEAPSARTA
jgi:hypothetical protein